MKIGRRAVQGTIFTTISTYSSLFIGIISSVIMARLLLPEHFGIIALGTFFLSLFGRVREFGFDHALIHRQDDLPQAFKTHFTLQVSLALINLILVLISIPILNNFYKPEVILVLAILGLFTLLQAASSTPRVFLEKELRFGFTTIVDIAALAISSLLGILAALLGFGLWSLVILNTSGTLLTFLGLYLFSGWRPRLSFDKPMAIWFLRFGFFLFIGGITTFVLFQYNDFIIGTFIGTATLGFYTKAFQFAQLPTGMVTAVVSRVALPTYSKLQAESEKLSIAYNLVLRNIFRLSAPFSLVLFLVADEFVGFFLGSKWLPMVPVFKLLLVFSMIRPIFDDTGAFLTAIGKPHILSKYLTTQAVILLILTPILVKFGSEKGAAVSLDIVMVVGVIMAYYYANRHVKIHYKQIFLPTILASVLTLAVYWLVTGFWQLENLNLFLVLIIKVTIIGLSYLVWVYLFERKQIKEDLDLFIGIIKEKNVEV